MVFRFGNIVVDIDTEKTAAFYRSSSILAIDHSLEGYQNFISGAERLDSEILEFFQKLGIDILKPVEMKAWNFEDDGRSVYYNGWYHICGEMISDSDCWSFETDRKDEIFQTINESNLFSITDNVSVGFTNSICLKIFDFPEPIIQMELFIHHFPWVLESTDLF